MPFHDANARAQHFEVIGGVQKVIACYLAALHNGHCHP